MRIYVNGAGEIPDALRAVLSLRHALSPDPSDCGAWALFCRPGDLSLRLLDPDRAPALPPVILALIPYWDSEGEDPALCAYYGSVTGAVRALGRRGIRANCLRYARPEDDTDSVALCRAPEVSEIARAAAYFIEEPGFIAGQTIDVNGGVIY